MRHRIITAVAAALLGATAWQVPAAADDTTTATEAAERQAALVVGEDTRLNAVRAVTGVARMKGGDWTKPYRLDTGDGYTLVLTQQKEPYTVADLLKLAPQTFVRQPDGSYLLTENIYLNLGAKLRLSNPGGLTLKLASSANGFVSIVSFGGDLMIDGSVQAPTKIMSWDPRTSTTDTLVDDGRAYLRAIGGQFSMTYASLENLGFWSGRTGGLSLTGTDRPNTGGVEQTKVSGNTARDKAKQERRNGTNVAPGAGDIFASPTGDLVAPDTRFDVPGLSYVSGSIDHATISGNAFGLFISGATGVNITDSTVEGSLEDGVVMHRFASSLVIEKVTSRNNGGDGFVLSRAAQQVRISDAIADRNGGNGITVNGLPLAEDASASGQFVGAYGSNTVSNSEVTHNGRYGIEVIGGINVDVQNNEVIGSEAGIVARQGANRVTITGNRVSGAVRHGIAVRDEVTAATVTGNIVTDVDNGVYVRDSSAEIRGNTVEEATNHGIALVGAVEGSVVSHNVISGVGPSALDLSRADGDLTAADNQAGAWYDTSSFWVKFRHYASPMTMLWTTIVLVIAFSAIQGVRRRRTGFFHPYENTKSLRAAA
ncbi:MULTISPECIES: right-handed parallel beta-helix repeat-containing protein [Catenuloplanes]|uniref:Parallel beta-helix repeat protein n=1 Tax=Catenuloplanes niger TaxID=587534 RepID=A0AAE3ZSF5_9ACTN|nr:right-handed parallel beta-helix repeat-containing protein [Catenuloplanes niger]MDR7324174.1 parallel beta-helix repeat protein [Catenuloplanes niger]